MPNILGFCACVVAVVPNSPPLAAGCDVAVAVVVVAVFPKSPVAGFCADEVAFPKRLAPVCGCVFAVVVDAPKRLEVCCG